MERQKQYFEREEKDARQLLNKGQDFLIEERKRSRHVLEYIFFPLDKERKIGNLVRTVEDAEKRLNKAKQDAIDAEKEMEKICDEYIKSLENMHIDVKKDISTDRMIKILKKGTKLLGKLQENWAGMTLYFKSINSYIEKVMNKQQNMFVKDAQDAQEHTFLIDVMTDTIKKSLESSIKSHRTAATYVKVSNNYIMEPLRSMHGMLAIEPAKMQKAQEELMESCKKASEGIKIMFNEDRAQTIREMENALQSPDPVQSIDN